jgi:catechol 2,3-dioxygenase-like lactoylglutathione lyase family enzyme
MAKFPAPKDGIALTHFIVSEDVERSRRFYTDVLGGESAGGGANNRGARKQLGHHQRWRGTNRR